MLIGELNIKLYTRNHPLHFWIFSRFNFLIYSLIKIGIQKIMICYRK